MSENPAPKEIDNTKYFALVTGILILMSALRMVLFGFRYGIPVLSYVNFSNLIAYIFDVLYGLKWHILIIGLLLSVRKQFLAWLRSKGKEQVGKWKWLFVTITVIAAAVFAILWIGVKKHTEYSVLAYDAFLMIGMFSFAALLILCFKTIDIQLLSLTLIFVFICLHMKAMVEHELIDISENLIYKNSVITFKDPTHKTFFSSDSCYYIGSTSDFVFIYAPKTKTVTTFRMDDIFSLSMKN